MPDDRRYRRDRQRNRDRDRNKDHDDSKKIILAKKETVKSNTPEPTTSTSSQPKLLLKPKEPERAVTQPSLESYEDKKEPHAESSSAQQIETQLMEKSFKLLSSEFVFNIETITPYVQEHSNDFLVVAFIGPQNSGKSTLANLLLNPDYISQNNSTKVMDPFEVRSKQHITKLGQITEGIDIFITEHRLIVLDCAPLLSNFLYKDYIISEMDDLKILTFLLNVCNMVVLVQDSYINPNVVRLIQTAEMMRTKSDEQLAKVMLVQNKVKKNNLNPKFEHKMKSLYKTVFNASNINCYLLPYENKEELKTAENVNFIAIPVLTDTGNEIFLKRIVQNFRMQILMTKRYSTKYSQTTQFNEKMWLLSLSKIWDSHSNNYFFKKYGNLKEKFNLLNHVSINDGIKYDKNVYYPDD